MSRFFTVLLAVAIGAPALAGAPADAMLSRTVQLQLQTTQGLLSAMDRGREGWRDDDRSQTALAQAKTFVATAKADHASGDDMGAAIALRQAQRTMGPGFKSWAKNASNQELKSVMKIMLEKTTERISVLRESGTKLPESATAALDRAESENQEAASERKSGDIQSAMESERNAMRGLDAAFGAMWKEWQADGTVTAPLQPATAASTGAPAMRAPARPVVGG
jgi:hypothetical protein